MKAMILAAGLGTRLRPLTDSKPKALIGVNGIPLLELIILRLIRYGFDELIINVHHFPGQIIDFVKSKDFFGKRIEFSDERDQLLDTGGGLLKASWFFDDHKPFLVHNVDVLTDLDLGELFKHHHEGSGLATLAVMKRDTSRYFLFDDDMSLCGWMNIKTGEKRIEKNALGLKEFAFSGIQVINPEIFSLIIEKGKFSLTDLYLRLCKNDLINGFVHNDIFWSDIGKHDELERVSKIYKPDF